MPKQRRFIIVWKVWYSHPKPKAKNNFASKLALFRKVWCREITLRLWPAIVYITFSMGLNAYMRMYPQNQTENNRDLKFCPSNYQAHPKSFSKTPSAPSPLKTVIDETFHNFFSLVKFSQYRKKKWGVIPWIYEKHSHFSFSHEFYPSKAPGKKWKTIIFLYKDNF